MSRTIDEHVVSMKFENKDFERNIESSISHMDKLKSALKIDNADPLKSIAKGVDSIEKSEVGVLRAGFKVRDVFLKVSSLLEHKIANKLISIGKSLTFDQVFSGMSEYELKLDSMRTIMASTGKSVKVVNKYLEALNRYSDQTIYSFSDMTQNIGKFTNAGVNLKTAVKAIQGISNEAAVSGANAQEASRAMYNFAQALSSGNVKLIDWKSIENANMATKEFKQQLIDTAVAEGVIKKTSKGMYQRVGGKQEFNATKNFNDALKEQWMTTKVLTTTLGKYADRSTDIGKKAFEAATKVTKLSQMFDVLKETVQSGWAKSFELIFGNIEKAKKWLTPLTIFISDIITKVSDWRNRLISGMMNSPFGKMIKSIQGVVKTVKNATNHLEKFGNVISKVINGDFGNGLSRFKKLEKAGYNWAKVQNLVNKRLGSSVRHNEKLGKAQKVLGDVQKKSNVHNKTAIQTLTKMSTAQLKHHGLTKKQIKAVQYLKSVSEKTGISVRKIVKNPELASGRNLILSSFKDIGKAIGSIFKQFAKAWKAIMPALKPRSLYNLVVSFKAFTKTLIPTKKHLKDLRVGFEGIISILNSVRKIVISVFKTAFKTIKSALNSANIDVFGLIRTIGEGLKAISKWLNNTKIIQSVFKALGSVVVFLVEQLKRLYDFLSDLGIFDFVKEKIATLSKHLELIPKIIKKVWKDAKTSFSALFDNVKNYFASMFKELNIGNVFSSISNFFSPVLEYFKSTQIYKIGEEFILGFINGVKDKAQSILSYFSSMFNSVIDYIKSILGIHSPSTIMISIGKQFISGFIWGFTSLLEKKKDVIATAFQMVISLIKTGIEKLRGIEALSPIFKFFDDLGSTIINWFKNINGGAFFSQISDGINKLLSSISSSSLFQSGKDLIDGFLKGFGISFDSLIQYVKDVANRVITTFNDIFGIHSPSTETRGMANNLIMGFVGGIKDFAPKVFSAILDFGKAILSFVKRFFSEGSPMAALAVGGAAFITTKITKSFEGVVTAFGGFTDFLTKLISPLDGLSKVFTSISNLFESFEESMHAVKFNLYAKGIKSVAISIALLVGCLIALAATPEDWDLWGAFYLIAAVSGVMVLVALAISKMAKSMNAVDSGKMIATLLGLSAVIFILGMVMKKIAGLGWEGVGIASVGLIVAIGSLIGLIVSMKALVSLPGGEKLISQVSRLLLSVSTALYIMSHAMKVLGKLDGSAMVKGIIVIRYFTLFIIRLIAISKLSGEYADKAGSMILRFSVALLALSLFMRLIGKMDADSILTGFLVIGAFEALIVGIVAMTKLSGEYADKAGKMIARFGAALLLMGLTVKMIGGMDVSSLAKGVVAVSVLSALIAGLILVGKRAGGKEAHKIGLMILQVAGAIVLLGGITALLGVMPVSVLAKGLTIVTVLSAIVGGLIYATSLIKDPKSVVKILNKIFLIFVTLGILMVTLTELDTSSVIIAAGSLSTVLGMIGLVLFEISNIAKNVTNAANVSKILIEITAILLIVGGVLIGLANLPDPNSALKASAGLSLLMLSLTASLYIISKIGDIKPVKFAKSLAGILALSGILVVLSYAVSVLKAMSPEQAIASTASLTVLLYALIGALALVSVVGQFLVGGMLQGIGGLLLITLILGMVADTLSGMSDVNNALDNSKALSLLMIALSGTLLVVSAAGLLALGALVGVAALFVLIKLLNPVIDVLRSMEDLNNALENAKAIGLLMISLATALTMISLVGPLALIAVVAIAALGAVIVAFGTLAVGIGALFDNFPILEKFLDKGVEVLIKVADGIGRILAAFITGFATSIMNLLPALGSSLSGFMDNAGGFISGLGAIDQSVENGANFLMKTIAILTAEGVIGRLIGNDTLPKLGSSLSEFYTASSEFITGMSNVDPKAMVGAECLAKAILMLTASNLVDKMSIFGKMSVDDFSTKAGALGAAVAKFRDSLGFMDEAALGRIKLAGEAVSAIAEAQSNIPTSGGVVTKWFVGDAVDLEVWGDKLPALMNGVKKFSKKAGNVSAKDIIKTKAAIGFLKSFAKINDSIPETGGWISNITGLKDLGTFADNIGKLGTAVSNFATSTAKLGSKDVADIDTIEDVIDTLTKFTDVARIVADIDSWMPGDDDLSDFGKTIESLGGSLVSFSLKLKELDDAGNVKYDSSTVENAATAVRSLAEAAQVVDGVDTSGIESFSESDLMTKIGNGFDVFAKAIGGVSESDIVKAAENADEIASIIKTLKDAMGSDFASLSNALYEFGTKGVASFIDGMNGFNLKDDEGKSTYSFKKVINGIVSELESDTYKKKFKKAGKNFIEEFTLGFKESPKKLKESLQGFGDKLGSIGAKLSDFYKNIKGVDTKKVEGASAALKSLGKMAADLKDLNSENLATFTETVPELGSAMQKFAKQISGKGDKAFAEAEKKSGVIKKIVANIKSAGGKNLTSLTNSLGGFGEKGLNKFIDSINNADKVKNAKFGAFFKNVETKLTSKKHQNTFAEAAETLMKAFSNRVATKATGTSKRLVNKVVAGIDAKLDEIRLAGSRVTEGFVEGIRGSGDTNLSKAYGAGFDLATEALKGINKGAVIKSPSKEAAKRGVFITAGLVNGILKNSNDAFSAGHSVGMASLKGISGAIAKAASMIDTDMSLQPTITPVVDTSGVSLGLNAINGMLSSQKTLNIRAEARRINSVIENRQNESAAVLKAITDLNFEQQPGNTYYIGDVAYDDGTNVASAVKQLVHAVNLDRRV